MPTFGKYETLSEVSQSSRGSVFTARPTGSQKRAAYVVKTFEPILLPGLASSDRAGTQRFLDAADAQRNIASKRSRHWVRIHQLGDFAGGAYYVSDYIPRTLERLIDGRVRVSSETLVHVLRSLVRALGELEARAGRAHGNLKASNVFLAGTGSLHKALVLVSDPLAPSELPEAKLARALDLKALGTILFRLVRRRDVRGEIGWPITSSPDWDALGPKGDRWRELCNTLLDPAVASKDLSLKEIERQIIGLRFRGARKRVLFGSIAFPGTLLLGAFLYVRFAPYERLPERLIDFAEAVGNVPPDVAVPPEEWSKLCLAYYDWLGAIQTALQDPARKAHWQHDPSLRDGVLSKLEDVVQRKISLDPRSIANVQGNLANLAAQPPDVVKKGAIRWHTLRAWKIVQTIKESLATWPAPARLDAAADRLSKQGWKNPAAEIRSAVARDQSQTLTADSIDDLLALAQRVSRVEMAANELNRQGESLRATRDALLSSLEDHFKTPTAGAADLAALSDSLARATAELGRWDSFVRETWTHGVDQTRFEQESAAAAERGDVTADRIQRWREQVKEYQFVSGTEDPRNQVNWSDLSIQVTRALEQYRREERHAGPARDAQAVSSAALQAQVNALAASVKAFRESKLIRKDSALGAQQAQVLAHDHRTLIEQIGNAVVLLHPDAGDWLKWANGPVFADTPALQSVWSERSRQLIAGVTEPELASNPEKFRALRAQAHTLETFLRDLASTPALPPATVIAETARADFREQAEVWLKTQRDAALREVLASVSWQGATPQGDAAGAWNSTGGIQAVATFTQARAAAEDVAEAYTEFGADLARGRALADGVGGLQVRVERHPGIADLLHSGVLAPITAAVEELKQIAARSERPALVARAAEGSLSGSLQAWRRLGALGTWPSGADELDRELILSGHLKAKLAAAESDAGRKDRLSDEFASETRIRWQTALRGAVRAGGTEVPAVFAKMDAAGVVENELEAVPRYDLQLSRLKEEMRNARTVEDADTVRARFIANLSDRPEIAAHAETTAFAEALRGVNLTKGDPIADLRRLGPGNVAWDLEATPDPTRVTYRWTSPSGQIHELTFVFVELLHNDPFFLCTTEMPVGLLLDVADANFVAQYMPSWIESVQTAAEDQRQGAQVWSVDFRRHGRLRLNDKWTGVRMPSWPDQVYSRAEDARPPSLLAPAQYLDPEAARRCAEQLLGCRLPTPSEWTELIQSLGGHELLKASWNFRDARWQAQQNYLVAAGGAFDLPWPDADIFLPSTLTGVPRGKDAVAATSNDDHVLWFADVTGGTRAQPFAHLLGNVAEFLFDPKTGKFTVAGGSALSPAELDPTLVYAVDSKREREGYSDVGFRPAFGAPDSLVGKSRLSRRVREQGYLSF